jgi:hypothetical protein
MRGGYWDDAEDEFEVGEVEERSETVHDWRHPEGSHPPLGPLPFHPEELSPPDAFENLEPEELELQEATGNEGASFERLYQRAALVLWPRARRAQVLAQGGLDVSVPFLGELVRNTAPRRSTASGSGRPLLGRIHVHLLERPAVDARVGLRVPHRRPCPASLMPISTMQGP